MNKKILTFVKPGKKICFGMSETGTTIQSISLIGKRRKVKINNNRKEVLLSGITSLPDLRILISSLEKETSQQIKLVSADLNSLIYEVETK
jgi:hypothetical protein